MSQNQSQLNIWPIVALIFAPFLALYLGNVVANEDYILLALMTVAILGAITMSIAHRHLLAIGFSIAILDLWAAPGGFKTSAMEQSGAITAAFWLIVFWRKNFNRQSPIEFRKLSTYDTFRFLVLISCIYAGLHFLYNMSAPFDELAFGWKGATKAYLQVFGPLLMVIATLEARLFPPVNARASRNLLRLFFALFLVGLGIKLIYTIRFGAVTESTLDFNEKIEAARAFFIPGINVWDNFYTLRSLGPAATLIGATFMFISTDKRKLLPMLLLLLGVAASLLSGGRATVIFALFLASIAMFRGGHQAAIFAAMGVLIAAIALILLLPEEVLRQTPWHVQRSIGLIRPDIQSSAVSTIEGSTDMRKDYFRFAWDYWSSGNARLIFTGRSVGQMDASDITSFVNYNEAAKMFFAIRRLATHNGLTDLLIGWGALGYFFIIISWVACFMFLHRYNDCFKPGSYGDCWIFVAKVYFAFYVCYMHIGGSFIWPLNIWLIIIALVQTDGLKIAATLQPVKYSEEISKKSASYS